MWFDFVDKRDSMACKVLPYEANTRDLFEEIGSISSLYPGTVQRMNLITTELGGQL